jgi:myo-inositol-1(or 4)-monophosphatase
VNLQKINAEVNSVVLKTAEFISEQRKSFDTDVVQEKGLNQLVSFVDIEAEKMLVQGLRKIVPEAGFITEENTTSDDKKSLNWIIDPLDGTTNFIHDVPVYSISIALAEEKNVLCGTVYEIGRKEMFTAWKNGGAWCNGNQIQVSKQNQLKDSLMATGFPYYDFDQMEAYLHVLKDLMKKTHGLRRMGSAAVDLAYVACGRFEGFFEYGLNPWDIAAGCLLVEEAGGKLSDFKDEDSYLFGNSIVADNTSIHSELIELIKSEFK